MTFSTAKPVKVGMIGLGAFGKRLIKPLRYFHSEEDIIVTGVCDIEEDVARTFAKEHGVQYWYTDYKKMLDRTDVDLVYIATPPATHKDIALFALKNKKHILCEKPLANSIAEAKLLGDTARDAGVVNALHFHLNYSPVLKKFSQLIHEDYIGELRRISVTMRYPVWGPEWQKNSWIETREQGGFVLEQGVHIIQAIQKVFGRISSVESELQYPADVNRCETGILAKLKLMDGTPVLIDGLSDVPEEERVELTAYGSKGMLSLKNWRTLIGGQLGQEIAEISTAHPSTEPWIMKHVLQAIYGQQADIYDFAVGYETQVVLEALRRPESKKSTNLVY